MLNVESMNTKKKVKLEIFQYPWFKENYKQRRENLKKTSGKIYALIAREYPRELQKCIRLKTGSLM